MRGGQVVVAGEHLASRAVRAARVCLALARSVRYEAGPLVALLALPPDALVGVADHVGRLQVAVALLVPPPRDLGMRRPQVVVAFQRLAVAAVGVGRLHRNGRRMALPRSCDRRVPQKGRGLVDVRAHYREAGRGCAREAVGRESPPEGFSLVFHDDQGSQHASRAFRRCLESHGIARSMSRPGNPWDDALAESFFKMLKRELVNGKGCKTREEAKRDVLKYIELCYNRQRMHSRSAITPRAT